MENHPKRQRTTRLAARNLKRKLSHNTDGAPIVTQLIDIDDEPIDLVVAIRRHVEVLNSSFSDPDFDHEAVKEAAADIADLAKIGTVLLHFTSNRRLKLKTCYSLCLFVLELLNFESILDNGFTLILDST
jgi:nitrous oxide reductase